MNFDQINSTAELKEKLFAKSAARSKERITEEVKGKREIEFWEKRGKVTSKGIGTYRK